MRREVFGPLGMTSVGFGPAHDDDVEALRARLRAAGYQESTPPNAHPHRKRVYFYDAEGNDWEFVGSQNLWTPGGLRFSKPFPPFG